MLVPCAAFFGGDQREHQVVDVHFKRLLKHLRDSLIVTWVRPSKRAG